MIRNLADLVSQERSAGSTDSQIVALLNASRIKPEVGRTWSEAKLVEAFGERIQGLARRR